MRSVKLLKEGGHEVIEADNGIKAVEMYKEVRPDAVLTALAEVPGLIRRLGYRIPQDIAVAGTSVLDIPVDAGVDQRPQEIGRIAVEMLVKQININERGEPLAPCRILIESTWQNGKSMPRRRG